MTNAKWGTKRTCSNCTKKFYDLHRNPATCPACGTEQEPDAPPKAKRTRAAAKPAPAPEVAEAKPAASEEANSGDDTDNDENLDDDAEDEAYIEDASELGEDEDDVAEVIVGREEEGESEERT